MHTGVWVGGAAGVGDEGLGGGVGALLVGTLWHERGIPIDYSCLDGSLHGR